MCLRNPDDMVTVFCEAGATGWSGAETRTGKVPQPGYMAFTGGLRAVDGRESFSVSLGYINSGGGVNHATGLAMATFGASGAYGRHVARVGEAYKQRRDTLTRALATGLPGLAVPSPAGGWFLWLPLPDGMTASTLLPVAERHGVSFVPGAAFYPGGESGERYIRLSFSFLAPAELTEAAGRLTAAMKTIRG